MNDLYYLCSEILGYPDLYEPLHRPVCEYFQRLPSNTYRLTLLPRGHFKTTIGTIGHSMWLWLWNPMMRILNAHYKADQAKMNLEEIKEHFAENDKWRFISRDIGFKDPRKEAPKWLSDKIVINRPHFSRVPSFMAVGQGASVVGLHFDWFKPDDLVVLENIGTIDQLNKTIEWFKTLRGTFRDPSRTRVDVIGTRWDKQDLYGWMLRTYGGSDGEVRYGRYILEKEYKGDEDEEEEESTLALEVNCMQATSEGGAKGEAIFPTRYTKPVLDETLESMGSWVYSCFPAEAQILLSDFTEKRMEYITRDDELIGFEVHGGANSKRHLVKTKVLCVDWREDIVACVTLDTGESFKCTSDHPFWTGRNGQDHHLVYRPLKVGDTVQRVCQTGSPESHQEWAYLAAMIDGEGAVNHEAVQIIQSQEHNPNVCDRIQSCLERLGIPFTLFEDDEGQRVWTLTGGREGKAQIIRGTRHLMAKKTNMLRAMWKRNAQVIKGTAKVVSIEEAGKELVYTIQTETGNFVANGYGVKNCQMDNNPVSRAEKLYDESLIRYYDPNAIQVLLDQHKWYFFTAVDPNRKQEEKHDDGCVLTMGRNELGHLYMFRITKKKFSVSSIVSTMDIHAAEYNPEFVILETAAGQNYLVEAVEKHQLASGHFYQLIKEDRGPNSNKFVRKICIQPLIEAGALWLPDRKNPLFEEIRDYPFGEDHCLDCLADIVKAGYDPRLPRQNQETPSGQFVLRTVIEQMKASIESPVERILLSSSNGRW